MTEYPFDGSSVSPDDFLLLLTYSTAAYLHAIVASARLDTLRSSILDGSSLCVDRCLTASDTFNPFWILISRSPSCSCYLRGQITFRSSSSTPPSSTVRSSRTHTTSVIDQCLKYCFWYIQPLLGSQPPLTFMPLFSARLDRSSFTPISLTVRSSQPTSLAINVLQHILQLLILPS